MAPGEYRVSITPQLIAHRNEKPISALAGAPALPKPKPPVTIPPQYQDLASSGLRITVAAGENPPFDFELAP